jgi:hypothetical protein
MKINLSIIPAIRLFATALALISLPAPSSWADPSATGQAQTPANLCGTFSENFIQACAAAGGKGAGYSAAGKCGCICPGGAVIENVTARSCPGFKKVKRANKTAAASTTRPSTATTRPAAPQTPADPYLALMKRDLKQIDRSPLSMADLSKLRLVENGLAALDAQVAADIKARGSEQPDTAVKVRNGALKLRPTLDEVWMKSGVLSLQLIKTPENPNDPAGCLAVAIQMNQARDQIRTATDDATREKYGQELAALEKKYPAGNWTYCAGISGNSDSGNLGSDLMNSHEDPARANPSNWNSGSAQGNPTKDAPPPSGQ